MASPFQQKLGFTQNASCFQSWHFKHFYIHFNFCATRTLFSGAVIYCYIVTSSSLDVFSNSRFLTFNCKGAQCKRRTDRSSSYSHSCSSSISWQQLLQLKLLLFLRGLVIFGATTKTTSTTATSYYCHKLSAAELCYLTPANLLIPDFITNFLM